jgi:hypothetical protein
VCGQEKDIDSFTNAVESLGNPEQCMRFLAGGRFIAGNDGMWGMVLMGSRSQ